MESIIFQHLQNQECEVEMKENIKDKIIDELFDLEIKMNGCSAEFWTELLLAEYNNKFTIQICQIDKHIQQKSII